MHLGPWEIAAFGGLYIGAFMLAADVGLRMSPNIRGKFPNLEKFQETGWWGFTPLVLLTLSGAIFLADAIGWLLRTQSAVPLAQAWQYFVPALLLTLVVPIWLRGRSNKGRIDSGLEKGRPQSHKLNITDDVIRQLNRTAFLLSTAVVQEMYARSLAEALAELPIPADDMPIDTNDKITRETSRIQAYLTRVGLKLSGSHWGALYIQMIREAEREADVDLLHQSETPFNLHPQQYRLFHIAAMSKDRTQQFLERSIAEAKAEKREMLKMLKERPEVHNRR